MAIASQSKKQRVGVEEDDQTLAISEEIDRPPTDNDDLMISLFRPKRLRDDDILHRDDADAEAESSYAKIIDVAKNMLHRSGHGSDLVFERRFRSHFGASPKVVAYTWDLLRQKDVDLDAGATIDRFMWSLFLLKCYSTEEINCSHLFGVDEKTFRKWAWFFIDQISFLEADVVSYLIVVASKFNWII